MAKSDVLYIPARYQAFGVTFANVDGTTLKTLYTVPADDANLLQLSITSSDTAARDLMLYINVGGTDILIGHIDIPASAGSNGIVVAVDGLNNALPALVDDTTINKYLPLKGGTILKAGMLSAVTTATQINVYGLVGDYTL